MSGYAAVAATLREIADRLSALGDRDDLPRPTPGVLLTVLPCPSGAHPDHTAAVSTVAAALLADAGTAHRQPYPYGTGGQIYSVRRRVGDVEVTVQARVPDPAAAGLREQLAARDAEVAGLAAEVRAAHGGRLTTAEGAREVIDAGGEVCRDDRYSGDYRYIVTREPGDRAPEATEAGGPDA